MSDLVNIKPKKVVFLNPMQVAAILMNQRYGVPNITIEAARGTGKSTVLGWFVKEAVKQMPRSTGVIVGETYVQIKSRTLPSTKEGLEMFGIFENIDYVVGRCGRSMGFEMPFQAPDSWNNVIHFRNGAIVVMVSLDDANSGRGLNSYWVIGDEAALLTHDRLFNNVLTTNRAKKAIFANKSMLHANIFVSSVAMTAKGAWFTEREELAKKDPKKYQFIKASVSVNLHNLKDGYLKDMRDNAISETIFNAEILNIRPRGVQDGFYAQLKDKHYYNHKFNRDLLGAMTDEYKPSCIYDTDLTKGVPLQFNVDFGARINSSTVSQHLMVSNEIRYLKEFFVKTPDILRDMVNKFIDYYQAHQASCNIIHLYHDRSGYKQEANSKTTLSQDIEDLLRKAGWKVINKTPNTNNPGHTDKFRLINNIMAEDSIMLPKLRINSDNCPNLIISMENAEISMKDGFEKDKSSERSKTIKQEHATHLSDTLDYNLFWQFNHIIDPRFTSSFIVSSL